MDRKVPTKTSINPFNTLQEFILQPYNTSYYFVQHSLDDVVEDAVTIAGLVGYFHFKPIKYSVAFAPVAYYGIKHAADFVGEYVEGLVKEKEEKIYKDYADKNFSLIDDFVEDVSKTVCLSTSIFLNIGAGQSIKMALQGFRHQEHEALGFKLVDYIAGIFGYMSSYTKCNELANAHGHWAVEQAAKLVTPHDSNEQELLGKHSEAEGNSE